MTNILIFGASRGLGSVLSAGIVTAGDNVWLVSRSRPETLGRNDGVKRVWIQADLASPSAAALTISQTLTDSCIDVLIYNAGIWEEHAFDSRYNFEEVSDE